jgi:hypothetical protein
MTSAGATGGMSDGTRPVIGRRGSFFWGALVDSALNNTMTPSESQILSDLGRRSVLFSLCLHWWKRPWGFATAQGVTDRAPSRSRQLCMYTIYTE